MSADLRLLSEVTDAAAEILCSPGRRRSAVAYLTQRGMDATGLGHEWLIGYAPPGWTRLVNALRDDFPEAALLDAGVARMSSRGTLIDSFRDRVIFGIRTAEGTTAGFIGRDLSGHPSAPKYLNTRRHDLFDKSSLLFGLHEGNRGASPLQAVVVEGTVDVLAIACRSQTSAERDLLPVAPCGTALTAVHAQRVAAQADAVVVAMDSDSAGRAAALRAGVQLRRAGCDVRIATLPRGADPASSLASSESTLDIFRAEHALPIITVAVEDAIARQGDRMQWIEGRLAALRSVARCLVSEPPENAARQIPSLADALALNPATVTSELANAYVSHSERSVAPLVTV